MNFVLIATAAFGLEAVVKREVQALGCEIIKTENGKVTFKGDESAIARANIWLRAADRVLIRMGEFPAKEPDDLFLTVRNMPWEKLIPKDGKFTVTCSTVKSRLRSEPNNQKTVKKAIVESLSKAYGIRFFPETGASYTVKVSLLKDIATITVDTTGESLHKRGYRANPVAAPLKETIGASMIELSFWKPGRTLLDPCCGSGTLPIEAALIGRNIAPGLTRHFESEKWDLIPAEVWKEERKKAYDAIDYDTPLDIRACDIDPRAIEAAKENADLAGVGEDIEFVCSDMKQYFWQRADDLPQGTVIVMNPPYGERIGDLHTEKHIYNSIRSLTESRKDISVFMITADKKLEELGMKRKADRRRKLYNGNIETCYYQFHGVRPPRKAPDTEAEEE
ncbi:MAG: class I SAM-dependent RNA methyltransferase [Eubacteriales bacterium]|nr:class I SAM-dependent RNA methyltransferase [Eubacteriales bacterium]